jgi:hypothetical protein
MRLHETLDLYVIFGNSYYGNGYYSNYSPRITRERK